MIRKINSCIQLLILGLLFSVLTSCDKTDNHGSDGQSAGELKDTDGNVYETVKIGSQVWMAENLKTTRYDDSTEITNVTYDAQWRNLTTGAYCNYDNLENNATMYGRLYNWYAVNTGKLAPSGWHVPTDEDWTILENYLIASGYNYDGTKIGNKFAKALANTTSWKWSGVEGSPGSHPGGNNSTNFSALPGGLREENGAFKGDKEFGIWWSSTEDLTVTIFAYFRILKYDNNYLYRMSYYDKKNGLSVRCVKDN